MTQEDKQLLIQDISARLPYGVKIQCGDYLFTFDEEHMGIGLLYTDFNRNPLESPKIILSGCYYGEDIKPYLFPLSSMTEEQKVIYGDLCYKVLYNSKGLINSDVMEYVNWCYKNHIDINNLIPMGLANDATNLGIYE